MKTEDSTYEAANNDKLQNDEQVMLSLIRDIILREDREDREEMAQLKQVLERDDLLAEKMSPIIEAHFETLKRKFPKEYKKQVEQIINKKLKTSQDELLDVIYPVMGTMVRKYVNHQFVSLKEEFQNRFNQMFSAKGWMRQFKIFVLGMDADSFVNEEGRHLIEEVYIIERDSGILLGHFAKQETIDRDLVAGMLTAIKSFVEDAFRKKNEELEMIDYGRYKIFIQTFRTYYISIVLNGLVTNLEKEVLVSKVLNFARNKKTRILHDNSLSESQRYEMLSEDLAEYFK